VRRRCGFAGAGGAAGGESVAERSVFVCAVCAPQISDAAALDEKHWFCLREAVWSAVPAVQVVSLRLLRRLDAFAWARSLRGDVYVADEVQAWLDADTKADAAVNAAVATPTVDSNGTPLVDGDAVTLIKDLDVKGAGFVAKRGTVVKNIRLTGDPASIEGKVSGTTLVLKTQFLKKA
jgi:protein PhnA